MASGAWNSRLTTLINHRRRVFELFPHAVTWRKHLGFTKPMAFNSKKEFNPQNALIREYMISVMKQWCGENIPRDEAVVGNSVNFWMHQGWTFFEHKFRFKFENHRMTFVMEFRRRGDDLVAEAKQKILCGDLKIQRF